MMTRYVEAASSYAQDIDNLILLIAALVGFWFLAAQAVFFGLIFRFRAKEGVKAQYITGEVKSQKRWISIPHGLVLLCDVFIIIGALRVWMDVKQTLPPADHTVRIIVQQWAWVFVQPGLDGKLDTSDDIQTVDELHVKEGATYHFQLSSRDVVHSFSVPAFRLKQDAVPGRIITGWFKPTRAGAYDIQCAEICGIGHGIMAARLYVETPEKHQKWMQENSPSAAEPVAGAGEGSPAQPEGAAPAQPEQPEQPMTQQEAP
jgi:cytochrome c oxidase subunit 2